MQVLLQRRSPAQRRGANNGGFPSPPTGEPIRVVRSAHAACGVETRIRIPASLPEQAVQRVVCDGCLQTYSAANLKSGSANAGTTLPGGGLLGSARDRGAELFSDLRGRLWPAETALGAPAGRLWAWLSLPIALLAVIIGLSLIQDDARPVATPAKAGGGGAAQAKFIEQPGYSLALPAGWEKTNPPDGAVFAAQSPDGSADATLWIEEDGDLSMKEFETRSLAQLAEIGENARVIDRVDAPTLAGTIIELRADTPLADGVTAPYRVTLRGAGPFRHYLATSQRPEADPQIAADIELLHGSLRPQVELAGLGNGS